MTPSASPGGKRGRPVAVVKQGSTSVPIYRGICRGAARFTLSFHHNGLRQRRTFGKLDVAKEDARLVALNIQRGMGGENDVRPQERESYLAAARMLEPLGVPLLGAVEDYVECRRRLGVVPLLAAVEEYLARHAIVPMPPVFAHTFDDLESANAHSGSRLPAWMAFRQMFRMSPPLRPPLCSGTRRSGR